MTFSTAHSKEFEHIAVELKPANDGVLKCDNCQNCMVRAIEFKGHNEMKYFCPVDHTITWSTSEPVLIKVCSRQLQYAEASTIPPAVHDMENLEMDLSGLPSPEDFEPDTKPFSRNI